MRRFIAFATVITLLALPAAIWAQTKAKGNLKPTVPAPKWKQSVLDAFFTDARQELVGEPPSASQLAGGATTAAPGEGADPAAGGDGFAWHMLVSPDTLEGEIKSSTTQIGEAIATKSKFDSGGHKEARRLYSILAVMFGVITRFDGDVKWKDKAAGLRQEMAKVGVNCKVNSDQAFNGAKARYEDLSQMLRGDNVKVDEPEDEPTWAQVSDRPPLMQRLDMAKALLAPYTANKGEFTAHKDEIQHQAQITAILARVIQDPSYEFSDDSTYQEFAKTLQQGAQDVLEAVQQGDADKAQAAMGVVSKACSDCHGGFRG